MNSLVCHFAWHLPVHSKIDWAGPSFDGPPSLIQVASPCQSGGFPTKLRESYVPLSGGVRSFLMGELPGSCLFVKFRGNGGAGPPDPNHRTVSITSQTLEIRTDFGRQDRSRPPTLPDPSGESLQTLKTARPESQKSSQVPELPQRYADRTTTRAYRRSNAPGRPLPQGNRLREAVSRPTHRIDRARPAAE